PSSCRASSRSAATRSRSPASATSARPPAQRLPSVEDGLAAEPNLARVTALTDWPRPSRWPGDTYSRSYCCGIGELAVGARGYQCCRTLVVPHDQPRSGEREARVEYDFDGGVCGSSRVSARRRSGRDQAHWGLFD